EGVAIGECIVNDSHHLVHWHVVHLVHAPVVRYLEGEGGVVFNYTITRFTMDAINNKKIVFLGIALAMVLLLAFTVREIKFRGILIPTICCLIFVVDVVNVIINASNILSYLAIVFDVAFIVLFVLYFIKRIKKHIARRRK
ncbi:MAG: hypothetical protein II241_04140, partial [Clostridia bacterium]|nr:hypothetical protein [Clostridia bacterium]